MRVFREHRGPTQRELAAKAEIAQVTVSQIETGKRQGSVDMLRAIARALGVELDDLVVEAPEDVVMEFDRDMATAPRDGRVLEIALPDGRVVKARWGHPPAAPIAGRLHRQAGRW